MIVGADSENSNEIFCRKLRCRRYLGEIVQDSQAISIGNVSIWTPTVLTCVCGRPYRFIPKIIGTDLIDTETLEREFNF